MANKFAEALKAPAVNKLGVAQSIGERPRRSSSSRKGTKHVGGYFAPDVSKQLRQIALDENSSVQALLEESLDMLFESRGKPTIAVKLTGAD